MKKGITLHPSMGQHIINHLSNFAPLPQTGVLAGQAVASAIMDLYAQGGGVYNDLDIFQALETEAELNQFKEARAASGKKHKVGTVAFKQPTIDYNPYERLSFTAMETAYRVLSSRKEGMVNTILYDLGSYRPGLHSKAANLINCFDLNCTRVAVDLATKQLSWTPEFQYFINTYQLQVSALQTPFHTAIRFANKLRQMPIYGDVGLTMEIVTSAYDRLSASEAGKGDSLDYVRSRFGRVHAGAFDSNHSVLAPYFELEDMGYGVFTLATRHQADSDIEPLFSTNDYAATILFSASRAYRSRLKESRTQAAKVAWAKDLMRSNWKTHWLMEHSFEVQGPAYLDGQVSETHFTRVANTMKQHQSLTSLLITMPLAQQFSVVKRLKRFAKTEGPWVYGLAETSSTAVDVLSDEAFQDLVSRERENFYTPLVEPAFPGGLHFGPVQVEELCSRAELMQEGDDMSHCVGGYAARILKGGKLFAIRTGPRTADRSTMEIGLKSAGWNSDHDGKYLVVQHTGFANKALPPRHENLGLYVEMRLNGLVTAADTSLSPWQRLLFEARQVKQVLKERERRAAARRLREQEESRIRAEEWRAERAREVERAQRQARGEEVPEDELSAEIPF